MRIRNILLVTRYGSDLAKEIAKDIARMVVEKGSSVYTVLPLSLDNAKQLGSENELKELDLDLAIAVGGDGTTLRAVRWLDGDAPVFSIKLQTSRGILSDITLDSISDAIDKIFANQFYIEHRSRIIAKIDSLSSPPSLNEIVIQRIGLIRTPTYKIKLAEDEIKQRMDGIMVSTPTGSTGYSYSMGGPILHENLDAIVLTPIASINRLPSLVIPQMDVIVQSDNDSNVIVDGQYAFEIKAEEDVLITKYPKDALFLRIERRGLRQFARLGF